MLATAREIAAAAERHGIRLVSEPRLDEAGADFLVGQGEDGEGTAWVLRSPRRPDALERATVEERALRLVRARLPVAVPDWRVFAPELIAYPRLGGEPAAVVDLGAGGYVWRFDETAPPESFVTTLAAALASLHAIEPGSAAGAGLPVESPARVREQWAARMALAGEVIDVPPPVYARWQAWIGEDSFWPAHSVLIHGDLHPAHILVDGEHRVTGLLDWTEARVSDPATDFALLFATLGADSLRRLLDRYREAGGRSWPRMEEHIAEAWSAYPAVIARFVADSGETVHRELAQALVDAQAP